MGELDLKKVVLDRFKPDRKFRYQVFLLSKNIFLCFIQFAEAFKHCGDDQKLTSEGFQYFCVLRECAYLGGIVTNILHNRTRLYEF